MSNQYKIIQWNCNGFANHFDEVKLITSKFNCLAICIQESRFKSNYHTKLKNFTCFFKNSFSGSIAHGGVCIYLNNLFDGEEITISSQYQVVAIKVKFPIKFIICSIYLPGSENISKSDLTNLTSQFNLPYLLLGDFNSHNTIWGSSRTDSRGNIIEEFIDENNLNILNNINCATHFSFAYQTFSNIDLSLVSPNIQHLFEWSINDDLYSSDHYPIMINITGFAPNYERRPCWNIKRANWEKFNCNFNKPLTSFYDINEIENYVTETILSSAHEAIPLKPTICNRKEVPWWNNNIKLLIKERRKLLKQFKRNMSSENLENFLKAKSETRKAIRESKRKSWIEFCDSINLKTSSSEVYRKIKSLNGHSNFHQITALDDNQTLLTDIKDIVNTLAISFAQNSSSSNYSTKFISYAITTNFPIDSSNNDESYNTKLTLTELKSALRSCHGTSPGPDNIRYEMLKNLDTNATKYILDFYNTIWLKQVLPKNWKNAIVIPVLKPGKDGTNRNNYRPISLTNCTCKLLERMINKRLVYHIEKNNILNVNQSGFRKNRGTIDNLAILHSDIMESFSSRKDLVAVFFDIRKAYDCVWKKLIFKKLNLAGIRGNMAAFISNFLQERKFCCMVGGTTSNYYDLENGVPQGSVLSVTLFLLAIDDILKNCHKDVKALLYADDLIIYCSGKKVSAIANKIQNTIKKLETWNDTSGFQFHDEKTVAIKFSRRKTAQDNPTIKLYGKNIKFVEQYKFLGITFDRKLTFKAHIHNIKAKANSKLNIIKMLRCSQFGSDPRTLLKILCSIVLPTIDYASIIYSSANKTNLKILEPILNTGIRLSIGAFKTSPAISMQIISSCPPLYLRRLKYLLNYTLKILALQNHPLYEKITNRTKINHFLAKSEKYYPFYVRAAQEFDKITSKYLLTTDSIDNIIIADTPPWSLSDLKVDYSLAYCNKRDMTPIEVHQKYLELRNTTYKNHLCLYTDGSVINEKAGFAVFGENLVISKRIHNYSSIYTSELLAIKTCIENLENIDQRTLIISDSKSALQGLQDPFSSNTIINRTRETITNLPNNEICFLWIPSHLNINGNETVDALAKNSLNENISTEYKYNYSDYRQIIRKYIFDLWNDMWQNNQTAKLYKIQKNVSHKFNSSILSKQDFIRLNRLKIGHCLFSHRHIIEKTQPPLCNCGQTLDVFHIFNECRLHHENRVKYNINNIEILNNEHEFENVKKFLTEINLYNLI